MKVRFGERALEDLGDILGFIDRDSMTGAARVAARIFDSAQNLGLFPAMGRVGAEPGTHEWCVPGLPYILTYEIDRQADEVVILSVFHGARDRSDR